MTKQLYIKTSGPIPEGCDSTGTPVPAPWEKCVHTEHCCLKHGCKYGDDDCPVATGEKPQSFPCEACDWDKEQSGGINYRAHAEALAEALERIASWPDGGNQYGQHHIKMFAAKALAAFDQDRGSSHDTP